MSKKLRTRERREAIIPKYNGEQNGILIAEYLIRVKNLDAQLIKKKTSTAW